MKEKKMTITVKVRGCRMDPCPPKDEMVAQLKAVKRALEAGHDEEHGLCSDCEGPFHVTELKGYMTYTDVLALCPQCLERAKQKQKLRDEAMLRATKAFVEKQGRKMDESLEEQYRQLSQDTRQ